jgi:hypothetical protein
MILLSYCYTIFYKSPDSLELNLSVFQNGDVMSDFICDSHSMLQNDTK